MKPSPLALGLCLASISLAGAGAARRKDSLAHAEACWRAMDPALTRAWFDGKPLRLPKPAAQDSSRFGNAWRDAERLRRDAMEGLVRDGLLGAAAAREVMTLEAFKANLRARAAAVPITDFTEEEIKQEIAGAGIISADESESRRYAIARMRERAAEAALDKELGAYLDSHKWAFLERPEPAFVHDPVRAGDLARGPASAPVTIISYNQVACGSFCMRVAATLASLQNEYADQVRFVFRPRRWNPERRSELTEAVLCAGQQDKLWPMYDRLMGEPVGTIEALRQVAVDQGLDAAAFWACLQNKVMTAAVEQRAVPYTVIGERAVDGAQPFAVFHRQLERALADAAGRPADAPPDELLPTCGDALEVPDDETIGVLDGAPIAAARVNQQVGAEIRRREKEFWGNWDGRRIGTITDEAVPLFLEREAGAQALTIDEYIGKLNREELRRLRKATPRKSKIDFEATARGNVRQAVRARAAAAIKVLPAAPSFGEGR